MELKGKIISFLGDSITEGVGVENRDDNRYDNVLKNKAELASVCNRGLSGTRIAYQLKPSPAPAADLYFCGRVHFMDPQSDVIVVFGGTNDYGHGDAPFGTMSDTDPSTYCGAVDYLMSSLLTAYPDAKVVFMTPAHRVGDLNRSKDRTSGNISDAKPLKAYVDVIKEKGIKYNISVLDLYENLGIDPNNEDDKIKYAPDGLHFNDDGHAIIAERLMEHLKNL